MAKTAPAVTPTAKKSTHVNPGTGKAYALPTRRPMTTDVLVYWWVKPNASGGEESEIYPAPALLAEYDEERGIATLTVPRKYRMAFVQRVPFSNTPKARHWTWTESGTIKEAPPESQGEPDKQTATGGSTPPPAPDPNKKVSF